MKFFANIFFGVNYMNIHIVIYIISAVIFPILFIILTHFLTDKKRRLAAEIKGRYNATALLTPTEAAFFPVIDEIAADYGLYLFSKVRFADVAKTARAEDYNTYMRYFGKVKSKHLDFVLCDSDFIPVVVVELDDPSHLNKPNRENDLLKDVVLESINIPLIRVPVANRYDQKKLARKIAEFC